MSRMNRDRLRQTVATVAAVVGVVLVCIWAAAGLHSGLLFAIAIGTAAAVAVFSDTRRTCPPQVRRRRR